MKYTSIRKIFRKGIDFLLFRVIIMVIILV